MKGGADCIENRVDEGLLTTASCLEHAVNVHVQAKDDARVREAFSGSADRYRLVPPFHGRHVAR